MSSFGAKGLTNKGRSLQAKAQAGAQLKYTKVVIGDGQLAGQSISALTNVISPKKTMDVTRLKMTPPNQATVGFVLSNQDITTGFYFREIGFFAEDPDEGEILYYYLNAGDTADYIPPTGTGDVINKNFDVLVYVGQAQNVTLTVDTDLTYVTHKELEEALEGLDPDIPEASLTHPGIVQLSNATNSTSESLAATPRAVKTAYDRADSAFTEATAAKQLGVEQKANVVAALNSIGVTASTNDTWAQLVAKLAGVIRATGNATAADLLSGRTASNASGPFTGTMPNRSAEDHHMPGLEATVWPGDRLFIRPPSGFYNGESWVTTPVPGLTAENLRAGVNVAGLIGNLVEGKRLFYGEYPGDGTTKGINPGFAYRAVVIYNAGGAAAGIIVPPGGNPLVFYSSHAYIINTYGVTTTSFDLRTNSRGGTHYVYVYGQ